MDYIETLRDLLAKKTGFDKTRILTYAEKGEVCAVSGTENQSFVINYKAMIVLQGYEAPIDILLYFATQFHQRYFPHLAGEKMIMLEFERVSSTRKDVYLEMPISETTIAERTDAGIELTPFVIGPPPEECDLFDLDIRYVPGGSPDD